MKYHVGQVIYVLNNNNSQVVPIQIVEQVTRKTLEGEKVTYLFVAPSDVSTQMSLDKIKGEIFDNVEHVRDYMKKNALKAIDKLVESSQRIALKAFGEPSAAVTSDELELQNDSSVMPGNTDSMSSHDVVVLPDGTTAKLRISDTVKIALALDGKM